MWVMKGVKVVKVVVMLMVRMCLKVGRFFWYLVSVFCEMLVLVMIMFVLLNLVRKVLVVVVMVVWLVMLRV